LQFNPIESKAINLKSKKINTAVDGIAESQSMVLILSRLIGEASTVGEDVGEDDGDERNGDDESVDMDGGDDDMSEVSSSSSSFLLLLISTPLPLSWLPTLTSLVVMYPFNRFTSDNFTGFTMKSSAPSSKHLYIFKKNSVCFNLLKFIKKL